MVHRCHQLHEFHSHRHDQNFEQEEESAVKTEVVELRAEETWAEIKDQPLD